jgi:hypothetical protein
LHFAGAGMDTDAEKLELAQPLFYIICRSANKHLLFTIRLVKNSKFSIWVHIDTYGHP